LLSVAAGTGRTLDLANALNRSSLQSSAGPAAASALTLNINDQSQTFATLTNTTVSMTGRSELHITGTSNPISGSVISLDSPDAWFFMTNVKPSVVNSTYLGQIRVNGAAAVLGTNVRVVQYELGTVVIPHAPSYQPFQAFTGPNFTGSSRSFGQYTYYNTPGALAEMNRNISSFRLKRGYMATVATRADGGGSSKVYIAQDHDIDVGILPGAFDNAIQFVRVFPWRWVSKKGASDLSPTTLDASWYYNWNNDKNSTLDAEYVPIRQQRYWPAYPTNKPDVTHLSGFNEPNNPVEDAYTTLDNGSVDTAISVWPELLATGLRVGSPAVTDGGKSWLYSFMDKAIANDLRVDYITIHNYQAGNTATTLYNWLKDIYDRYHLPIWVTEFNNGANWTTLPDPTYAQNATAIGSFIDMFDTTPWIERYAIYSNVEAVRQMTYSDGSLTPAGQVYHDNASPIGYVQDGVPSTNTAGREIAQLPLDGNTLDASGYGNNGEAVGAPSFVTGQRGQAIELDGVGSYVRLPENIGASSAFSFAAWVYWDGGADLQRIFDFGNGTSQFFFLTPSVGGKLRFGIRNNTSTTSNLETTSALPANSWQHVAVTMQGTTARIYVNGVQQATGTLSATSLSGTTFNYLGKSQWPADPYFKGRIDDVHVTDYVLTQAQIAGLMNDTSPQFGSGTIALGPAARGVTFGGTLAGLASDADAGDTLAYGKVNGPAWLSVAANGALSGTPTLADQGPQEFVVSATDSKGALTYAVLMIPLAEFYWRGDVNNAWSTNSAGNTNWSTDAVGTTDTGATPGGATADVVFAADNAANLSTVLGADVSVRNLRVATPSNVTIGGAHNLTIGPYGVQVLEGSGAATINTSGQLILGTSQTWTTDGGLTVDSVIGGGGRLTKTGIGALVLNGNDVYTGGTTVSAGTLSLGSGGTAGGVVGNVTNNATLVVNRSNNLTLDGVISGAGDLAKSGGGWLTLSNTNTYSGETRIGDGVIQAAANNALGTGLLIIGPGGNGTVGRLNLTGGVTLANAVSLPMRNNSTVAVENVSGSNWLSGTVTITVGGSTAIFQSDAGVLTLGAITSAASGARTLTFTGAGTGVIGGAVSDGSGIVSLVKSGTGTWTLTGNNTYTGGTVVNAGTLALTSTGGIANTSELVLNGGTFATGGSGETMGPLTLSGNATIDLGNGASTLSFSGPGTFTAGRTLTIANWTPGSDHLFVGTSAALTAAQLAQIKFNGVAGAQQLSTGEIVPVDQTPPALVSALSRKTDASAGTFDLPLDLAAGAMTIEPRLGGPSTLVFNFSEPVFAIDGTVDGGEFVIGGASFGSASVSGSALTLQLGGVADVSRVSVAVQGLRDAAGNALAATSVGVGVLGGDVTGDAKVDFGDLVVLAQNYNTVGGMTLAQGDLNYDGDVNFADLVLLAQSYNTSLPAPTAAAPAVAAAVVDGEPVVLTRTAAPAPVFNTTTRVKSPTVTKPVKRIQARR
jgi:autotransporter-associated beta strand protein